MAPTNCSRTVVILFDAHLGDALATFTYVDPAIRNDNKPTNRTPSLDMFAAANGYPGDAAAGSPTFKSATYGDKFKDRFFQGAGRAQRRSASGGVEHMGRYPSRH